MANTKRHPHHQASKTNGASRSGSGSSSDTSSGVSVGAGKSNAPLSSGGGGGGDTQHQRATQMATPIPPSRQDTDPEVLLQMFLDAAYRLWIQIKRASSFIMVELGGYQAFDKVARWCIRNPYVAICLVAGGLTMLVPFLIVLGFGISSLLVAFTGFLVMEGTLLTVLSVLLFGCLGALVIVLLFFAVIGVAMYFGFQHIYELFGPRETPTPIPIPNVPQCAEVNAEVSKNRNPLMVNETHVDVDTIAQ